jgi:hypothetical protein
MLKDIKARPGAAGVDVRHPHAIRLDDNSAHRIGKDDAKGPLIGFHEQQRAPLFPERGCGHKYGWNVHDPSLMPWAP